VNAADPLPDRWRPWFCAAAIYNVVWGAWVIALPNAYFELIGMPPPSVLPVWQVVGMFVLLWAPAYWWAATFPDRFGHLILLAMIGKVLGPIGYVIGVASGSLPLVFGLTIITNDIIWWPAFGRYLRSTAVRHGGWQSFVSGS
jgi:hypothetical protein